MNATTGPKPKSRRWLPLAAVALACAALGAWVGTRQEAAAPAAPDAAGAILPSLVLDDADGRPFAFSTLNGRPVLVNFWATWCAPCVKEMPELSALNAKHGGDRGVAFVGIAIDSPSSVREFAAKTPVSYPLVIGGMGGTELVRRFGNASGGLPFTVLVGADGRVLWRHMGIVDAADLDRRLAALASR